MFLFVMFHFILLSDCYCICCIHFVFFVFRLERVENIATGFCMCLIYNEKTAKYANIGASEKFSLEYFKRAVAMESQTFLRPIDKKQIVYIEGYFLMNHADLIDYIIRNHLSGRRRLALNLCATYVIEDCFNDILNTCYNAFFIFGNQEEFTKLAEKMGCTTIEAAARQLMHHGDFVKILVVTKDKRGVDLITNYIDENSKPGPITFQSFNVKKVENFVDDTGAGDSFAAAFLHAWLEKRQLSECIRFASDIAAKVVTQIGCKLPPE